MSSGAVVGLAGSVEVLLAVPPAAVSVSQLQGAIREVSALGDRLGGWLDSALGELAAAPQVRCPPPVGTAVRCRSGRGCARPPCAAAPRPARRCAWPSGLRELSAVRDAVVNGTLGREQAAVLTRLVGPIHPEELLASQDPLIEVAAGRDPHALAVWERELIATHCEPQLDAEERTAQSRRYLQTRHPDDGAIRGTFVLPVGDAETVLIVLEPWPVPPAWRMAAPPDNAAPTR